MSENKFSILNHQVKIYIVNGMGTSGKTSFENFIHQTIFETINISSIDYAKEMCKLIGWDGNKDEKGRKFLSDVNLALEDYNNSPFQSVLNNIEYWKKQDYKYFFVDIREPQRIDKFKKMCKEYNYQVFTVFIRRPGIPQITSNVADASTLKPYDYDYYLDNDGTLEEWYEKSAKFAREIILGIKEGE